MIWLIVGIVNFLTTLNRLLQYHFFYALYFALCILLWGIKTVGLGNFTYRLHKIGLTLLGLKKFKILLLIFESAFVYFTLCFMKRVNFGKYTVYKVDIFLMLIFLFLCSEIFLFDYRLLYFVNFFGDLIALQLICIFL